MKVKGFMGSAATARATERVVLATEELSEKVEALKRLVTEKLGPVSEEAVDDTSASSTEKKTTGQRP